MKDKILSETFFSDAFLVENTDDELQKLIDQNQDHDPYYIASGCIKERRDKFDGLWENFKLLKDNNFLGQYKLKGHFHQKTWEMYFGNVLSEYGFSFKCLNDGPDFVVDYANSNNQNFYVECVAPTRGEERKRGTLYSVPEIQYGFMQDVPTDKMLMRITGAIVDKTKQYSTWKNKKWFDEKIHLLSLLILVTLITYRITLESL